MNPIASLARTFALLFLTCLVTHAQWKYQPTPIPAWGKKIKSAKLFSDKTSINFLEND